MSLTDTSNVTWCSDLLTDCQVDWSDVATDDKGKFMEGGPYCVSPTSRLCEALLTLPGSIRTRYATSHTQAGRRADPRSYPGSTNGPIGRDRG